MSVAPAYLVDSGSQVWQLGANDDGSYKTTQVSGPAGLDSILLLDAAGGATWALSVNTDGSLGLDSAVGTGAVTAIPVTTTGGDVRGIIATRDSADPTKAAVSTTLLAPSGDIILFLASVTATFSDGRKTFYNERYFHVPDPGLGSSQIYYVSIADPKFTGETPGLATLLALCETNATDAHVGEDGYIFMGAWLVAGGGGTGSEINCGGWPQGEADTGDFYVN